MSHSSGGHKSTHSLHRMRCVRSIITLAGVSLAASLLLLWPLIYHGWAHTVVLGARPAATVPLFNLWTYEWTTDFLREGFSDYWNAPIFYPYPGAFAMSDPQPLTGVAYAVLRLVLSEVAAMNTLLLVILTANGVAAGMLAMQMGRSRASQIIVAAIAVWLPFVSAEMGVLQMTVVFPIFLALMFLYRFHHNARLFDAVGLAVCVSVSYLTSGYWGLWLAMLSAFAGVCLFSRSRHANRRTLIAIGCAIATVAVVCAPFVYFQKLHVGDAGWPAESTDRNAAALIDYLRVDSGHVAARMPWTVAAGDWPIRLYPGLALVAAAIAGTVTGLRSSDRRWVLFLLIAIQFAALLSFGRISVLGDASPMVLLQEFVPGFDKLRSPYRVGVFVSLLLLPLAAIGVDSIRRIQSTAKRRICIALLALGLIEVCPVVAPVAVADVERTVEDMARSPAWCDALAHAARGPVIHLPMGRDESSYLSTVQGMLMQRHHGKPMIGGYSGLFPPSVTRLEEETLAFPDRRTAALLLTAGTRYLVIDEAKFDPAAAARLAKLHKLFPLLVADPDAGISVYRFRDDAYQQAVDASARRGVGRESHDPESDGTP